MKTLLALMLPAFAMLPAFGHANICDRTPQVRDAIMEALEADDCAAVGSQELASVVNPNGKQITTLKAGDFDNLTRLQQLELAGNQLTSLPAGVFDSLANRSGFGFMHSWLNLFSMLQEAWKWPTKEDAEPSPESSRLGWRGTPCATWTQ